MYFSLIKPTKISVWKYVPWTFVLLCFCFNVSSIAQVNAPAEPGKSTILVIGLQPTQFYSNVYYIDELARLNDTSGSKATELYSQALVEVLTRYTSNKYRFVAADAAEMASIHARSTYVDWQNEYKEPYVALDADTVQDVAMKNLMQKYGADYLLSLNYYLIYRNNPPAYYNPVIRARHQIHYELFDATMRIASAGQILLTSSDARAQAMRPLYPQFAEVLLSRLAIWEGNYTEKQALQKYVLLRERLIKNRWGGGLSVGWGMPYGWFGAELVRNVGSRWDVSGGIGVGPSGFKAGAGLRYYLLDYGTRFKPFFGAHYAWGSGMTIRMGGENDESGNLINEEYTTQFYIPSNHAVHLKTGFRWLKTNKAFLLSAGYGIALKDKRAEVLFNGNDVPTDVFSRRRNWANRFIIGGLDVGITYIIYFL
ncbi:hypothetical protein Q0590_00915 [Rhodocytophaga aerolata]|uniref:DUF3575 domain-containing protein n=1 Tax=Rhodocytophaga aerolata TaxID=455078 RepID=A0ABT8QY68_9BACT|nr:hypothetical protein [Rhodocytophaga aerolata]MDO1444786.1 hypothetical protein [Rhodocytophaga aerolata]